MKILVYVIRFFLAILFIYAGIEKLFFPFNPSQFKVANSSANPLFFEFYNLLQQAGYLYFVGFFQLLCGILMVFKRTYALASIMLVPLILCLLMTHVFISKHTGYLIFDSCLFLINAIVIAATVPKWKSIIEPSEKGWF